VLPAPDDCDPFCATFVTSSCYSRLSCVHPSGQCSCKPQWKILRFLVREYYPHRTIVTLSVPHLSRLVVTVVFLVPIRPDSAVENPDGRSSDSWYESTTRTGRL